MIKILGVLFIISSTTLFGFKMSMNLSEELEGLLELKHMIILLEGEIRYKNEHLEQAFLCISTKLKHPFLNLGIIFSDLLKENTGSSAYECWCLAIEESLKKEAYLNKHIKFIKDFGRNLGFLDKETQLKNFDFFIIEIENEIETLRNKIKKSDKIYKLLGFFLGVMVAIIVI